MESASAIILRKTRFGDTSLIVTWLVAGTGKLKTIARGAMRRGNQLCGVLDLFFDCEITFARSAKSELHALRECTLINPRDALRRDFSRVALASYFVELLDHVTEPEHPADELHDLLRRALDHLDAKHASRVALLHFESELARLLGIRNPGVTPIVAIGRAYHRIPAARAGLIRTLT